MRSNSKILKRVKLRKAEDGGRTAEGLLFERIEGEGGGSDEVAEARGVSARDEPEMVVLEPPGNLMSCGDRREAEG